MQNLSDNHLSFNLTIRNVNNTVPSVEDILEHSCLSILATTIITLSINNIVKGRDVTKLNSLSSWAIKTTYAVQIS